MKRFVFFISFFILSGCAQIQTPSVQSEIKVQDEARSVKKINAPLSKAVLAATQALKELELNVTKTEIGKDSAQIYGEYTDTKTIWINLRSFSEYSTQIEIQVGLEGNKEASNTILEKIRSLL